MAKKKYIGQLISVKFTDRKEPVCGLVIDYNDDWTLMKYNPVDYIIDGYIIFRHKNIHGFQRDDSEIFKEKIIKLKGLQPTEKENIPLTDLKTILTNLSKTFGVFQLQLKSETVCYLGRLSSIDTKHLIIDFLDTKGKWAGQKEFKLADIRTIEYDNDYINSLKLVAGQKRKIK